MNINEFEENLNNFTVEPAKAMAIVLNMCIKHQAMLECIISTQCMILAQIEDRRMDVKDIHANAESDINDRITEIQAQIATLF